MSTSSKDELEATLITSGVGSNETPTRSVRVSFSYNNDIQLVNKIENKTETSKQYEVSKLVRPSVSNGEAGYIVKWKGYLKESDNTWQSRERLLEDIPKMVHSFDKEFQVVWTTNKNKKPIFKWINK